MICLLQGLLLVLIGYYSLLWLLRRFKTGNYDDKYVFITGCDTGFGNLLARRLAKKGCHVFAGCFNDYKTDIFPKTVTIVKLDVTKEESIERARQFVEKNLPRGKGLWAVVNNAGIAGVVAPGEWLKSEDFRQVMEINFFGVVFVTKAFLPLLRKEKGRVVNMASLCGRFAMATTTYSASKYAVEGFSDSLRRDLYTTGVTVHIIEPGFFATGIVSEDTICQGLDERFYEAPQEVQQYYGKSYMLDLKEKTCRLLMLILSPKIYKVVDAYEHAVTASFPKKRYVVGWDANLPFRLLWNLPEGLCDWLLCLMIPVPEHRQKQKSS